MTEKTDHRTTIAAQLIESAAEILRLEARAPERCDVVRAEFLSLDEKRKVLPSVMQAEIAWAMTAELYLAYVEGRTRSVKQVCLVSGAPDTTALRYLKLLCDEGWVRRVDSTTDGRVVKLSLSQAAVECFEAWADQRANAILALVRRSEAEAAKSSTVSLHPTLRTLHDGVSRLNGM